MSTPKRVPAEDGGCWYCETDDGQLHFCWEFDTNLHLDCLRAQLAKYPTDPETRIIADEFAEELKEDHEDGEH